MPEVLPIPERHDPVLLQPFLKCFHDIQMSRIKTMLNVSYKIILAAQKLDGPESYPWPFIKLRNCHLPQEKWVAVRKARADAIRSSETSEGMRYCLYRAERAAICMRALHMPRIMVSRLEAIDFPAIPDDMACLMRRQIMGLVGAKRDTDAGAQGCKREVARVYRKVPSMAQMQEVMAVLHLMVDLPIKKVCSIIGLSQMTIMALRKEAKLEVWPYEAVGQGRWIYSVDEIRAQREAALARLGPDSYQAYLLAQAREAVMEDTADRPAAPPPPPSPSYDERYETHEDLAFLTFARRMINDSLQTRTALEPRTTTPENKEEETAAAGHDWSGRSIQSDDEGSGFSSDYLNFWRDISDSPGEMWASLCEAESSEN